jgi:hypothetical protein
MTALNQMMSRKVTAVVIVVKLVLCKGGGIYINYHGSVLRTWLKCNPQSQKIHGVDKNEWGLIYS